MLSEKKTIYQNQGLKIIFCNFNDERSYSLVELEENPCFKDFAISRRELVSALFNEIPNLFQLKIKINEQGKSFVSEVNNCVFDFHSTIDIAKRANLNEYIQSSLIEMEINGNEYELIINALFLKSSLPCHEEEFLR